MGKPSYTEYITYLSRLWFPIKKKKIFIPFISNGSADQNQQMIPKVAIGAVHHLTRLEVSLKWKTLSCHWTKLIGNKKKVLDVDLIKGYACLFSFSKENYEKPPAIIGCADNRCKK